MKKTAVILSILLMLSCYAQEVNQQDLQRYSAYYSNGMEYLKNKQYSSAISEFKKVLRFSPYDSITQASLANAYLARAQYLRQTTHEVKKALTDYKSAVFYAKYWSDTESQSLAQLAASAQNEINSLEKRLELNTTPALRFQEAKTFRAQGELAAAAYDFIELKNSMYKDQAFENLGNIYKNLNNLKYAMDYFKIAIDNNPKNAKLRFLYGVMLDEAKNYEASMEQYNLALEYGDKSPELMEILENKWTQNIVNNPNDAQSYINLGAIYQKKGNFEAAKAQYLKASMLDSTDDTALYNLASLYVEQKNYQSAIGIYDKLLIKHPEDKDLLNYKAEAYKALGNYELALKQYETLQAKNPNDNAAKANIDDIILNHFSGPKLQSYLLSKAQTSPQSYEAQFNYALELHKNKDYKNAITYYKKALNINPAKEETYLNLAAIYIEQNDYKNANHITEQGLMVIPDSAKLNQYLAEIKEYNTALQYETAGKLFEAGKYSDALKAYLAITNKTKDVKLAIASCYQQMNDFKNANKYYLELLAQNPNDIDVLTNSAYAYYSMKDNANAIATANKILAIDKDNKYAVDLINDISEMQNSNMLQEAVSKYEKADYNGALTVLNKLLAQKSNDEYALYYKGLCLDELKKPQDAMKQYKLLISKNPNFESAYYSLAVDLDNAENYKDAVTNYQKFVELKKGAADDMTAFASSRIKELNEYLNSIKK